MCWKVSGATASSAPVTAPTVSDKTGAAVAFGSATTITFTSGVATVGGATNGVLALYRAETAVVAVTDGTISAAGADRLTVTTSAAALNKFALALTTPQTASTAFTGTNRLTAQDAFGNAVTGFNAAADNVTLVANAPLSGTISGLSGGNVLTSAGDFAAGVANLTTRLTYTGTGGTGTVTATSASGKTGTSGGVTVNTAAPALIPQTNWTLQSVDSAGPGYPGTYAFDGNGSTAWTTSWTPTEAPLPHEIQINLGAVYDLSGFRHLPRQDGSPIGRIAEYEFYVSVDGINWGAAVATGTLADIGTYQDVLFTAKTGRYIRLRALTVYAGAPYVTLAELNVLGVGASGPTATRLVITGTGAQTAGTAQSVTITAKNAGGSTVTAYAGDKTLTFSGATASSAPVTAPTVTDKNGAAVAFGTATTIMFTNGVATVSGANNGLLTLYRAETAVVAVTDGTISAAGADRLTVTATTAALNKLALVLAGPQTSGAAFTGTNTLTAQDAYGNVLTGFNAAADNVTLVGNAPLSGTISGLSGGNTLLSAGDFSAGVANLTTLGLTYTGATGTGTFTATSASAKTGTSGSVTVNAVTATRLVMTGAGTQTAGTPQSLTITAKTAAGATVTSYAGDKALTFSGATASSAPVTPPTVNDKTGTPVAFGTATTITFTNGVATVSGATNGVLTLYRAQTAIVAVTDGTISGAGADGLTVTTSSAALNKFALVLASPQTSGAAFTGTNTLTAQDAYGNVVTGFNAAANNVTFVANAPLSGSISGLSGGNVLTSAGDFAAGVANLTTLGLTYTGTTGTGTFTATSASAKTGTSGNVTLNAVPATRLVITGAGTQTAGTPQSLTITAKTAAGATVTSYAGDKALTFSGATASSAPVTAPTVNDKTGTPVAFGTATTITFTNGVATVSGATNGVLTLYRAEAAVVAVSDGTISAAGADRLSVTVSAAALNKFALGLASPQTSGAAFTGTNTLTAQDAYGNVVTGFNAAADNVTFVANAPLSGTISGLSGGNTLSSAGDFTAGVANLTTLGLTYTGTTGTGTFTATSASAKTGTSGNVTVNAVPATRLVITGAGTQTAGTPQSLTLTAKTAAGATVTSYAGDKALTFSGATASSAPVTAPTVNDKTGTPVAFGSATTITFTNGVATVSGGTNGVLTLYRAETAIVAVSDGTISAAGADRLSVTVSAAALNKLALGLASPQTSGAAFTGTNTLTAQDAYGNVVTGFNAAADNVTFVANAPLSGTISGLSGGNVLTSAGDFAAGVANLTTRLTYTGTGGTGTVTATSASGKTGTSGSVTVNTAAPALIPQTNWTLQSVDSAGPGYPGTYAFDGNGGTAWTTSWTPTVAPLPHEIQINLGAVYDLSGFRHLPRQDGSPIGRIAQYEFYVSLDGINWGAAVATGTLADIATQQDVPFTAKTGRYIRLRALTVYAGAPYVTLAELNVLGVVASGPTATRLVITGTGAQTAGTAQSLTITAKNAGGSTVTAYAGDKTLTFSGATASSAPVTAPTVTDKNGVAVAFGTATTIMFTNGVATVSGANNGLLTLYRAETAVVAVTDGTISAAGADRLTVTASAAALNKLALGLASPQTSGAAFTGTNTLTAQDAYGNVLTGFNASADNVTLVGNAPLSGTISGLSGGNTLLSAGDFSAGVANLTTLGFTYTGATGTGTFTATSASAKTGTSGSVTVNAVTATRLVMTGAGTQTAATPQSLTITAKTAAGATVTSYAGDKALTFSGATSSTNPVTAPTVSDKTGAAVAFGGTTTITFTNGVATVSGASNGVLALYRAETAVVAVTDGTISAAGADRLTVTASAAALNKFALALATPQTTGAAFTGTNTVTAQDAYGNAITGFNASADNVTFVANAPLSGTISGLSGGNRLSSAGDFSAGVANLTTLGLTYTGATGTGTFTATSASAKTGTSGNVTVNAVAATRLVITGAGTQTAGLSSTVGSEAWNSRDLKSRPH